MGNTIGWGIIGATGWANHTFGPAILQAQDAELRAVLSSTQEKAETYCERHGVPRGYTNLDDFVSDDTIDAVWIASPNHLHASQAVECLAAGKHVLCEKPMATTVAECDAMMAAAERAGRLLSIGYHMRFHPVHQELQRKLREGGFGTPICVRAHLYFAYSRPPAAWRQHRATSGGWALGDVGTHLIDLTRWFLGDAERVHGELSSLRFNFETEDHAVVTIRFGNGALGVVDASTGAGGAGPRLEVYGADGFCVCDNTLFGGPGKLTCSAPGGVETVDTPPAPLYQLQVEHFGAAIRGETPLRVEARDGRENVRIMERARGW